VNCTATVNNAMMTIKMQRLSGGRWVDVGGGERTTNHSTMAANASYQFNTHNVRCVNGTYRAAARGSATLIGNPLASTDWQYGNSASIRCR